jgi:hypothetical protein
VKIASNAHLKAFRPTAERVFAVCAGKKEKNEKSGSACTDEAAATSEAAAKFIRAPPWHVICICDSHICSDIRAEIEFILGMLHGL